MSIKSALQNDITRAKGVYVQGQGIVGSVFSFFQGRSTFFACLFSAVAIAFAVVSLWGFIHGKDLTSLSSAMTGMAALIGAIYSFVVIHSAKEDWHQQKQQQQQSTTVVNNVTVDPATGKTQS